MESLKPVRSYPDIYSSGKQYMVLMQVWSAGESFGPEAHNQVHELGGNTEVKSTAES